GERRPPPAGDGRRARASRPDLAPPAGRALPRDEGVLGLAGQLPGLEEPEPEVGGHGRLRLPEPELRRPRATGSGRRELRFAGVPRRTAGAAGARARLSARRESARTRTGGPPRS